MQKNKSAKFCIIVFLGLIVALEDYWGMTVVAKRCGFKHRSTVFWLENLTNQISPLMFKLFAGTTPEASY